MYERILVPTDGSEGATMAVDHAIEFAKRFDAALHTLFVVETEVGSDAAIAGAYEAFEAAGQDAVDDVIERAEAASIGTIEGMVAQGTPHRAILEYVEEYDIDLVVMGTHGRTGIDRLLLGSVTEKVVRLSPVPVLTVGSEEFDEGT